MSFHSLTSLLVVRGSPVVFSIVLYACGGGDKTLGTPERDGYGGDSTSTGSSESSSSGGSGSAGGVTSGGTTSGAGGSSAGGSGTGGTSACVAGDCAAVADVNDSFDFDCNGKEELCAGFTIAAADCSLGGAGCLGAGYLPLARTGEGKNSYCGSTNYQFCQLDTSVGCIKTSGTTLRAAECK